MMTSMTDMRCWLTHAGDKLPLQSDGTGYLFKFLAVPVHAYGSRDAQRFTREFDVVVEISGSLRHCGEWRNYTEQQLLKHLFEFVRENLERNGLPEGKRLRVPLLTSTEAGRFERGSPFSINAITPTLPFVVANLDARSPMSTEQMRQLRTRFLSQLYSATGAKQTRATDKWSLGEQLGLDRATTFDVCSFLEEEGLLIHKDADRIGITHQGIRRAESGIPVGVEQAGTTNVIQAGTITGSTIQQAGHNSAQTSQISNPSIEDLRKFMAELRKVIEKTRLPDDRRSEVAAEADSVDAQLRAPKPRWAFVRECLASIRNIVENAAGNLLGDLFKTFPMVAAWIPNSTQGGN
jgi:hypothetical protein